jgi:pimeloyl-ACP methyl ester carboxylesterase
MSSLRFGRLLGISLVALASGCSSSSDGGSQDTGGSSTPDAGSSSGGSGGGSTEPPEPYPDPAPDDCITDITPGNQELECEGLSFQLTVPDSCLTERCGLITDVHGFAMNAAVMEAHSLMQEIATAKGFIVLQPSAPGQVGTTASWSPDNDAQVFALMNHVIDVWHVDDKRIHFDGYSMGGWMTWRFVCNHADLIASAAPIAAGYQAGGCDFEGASMPSRQMPILYTHGRDDGLVSYSTAEDMVARLTGAWYADVQPEVVAQASDYEWDRYTSSDGNVFEFVQHDWACDFSLGTIALKGHCFPGSGALLGCGADNPFVWNTTVLQFFIDHPME